MKKYTNEQLSRILSASAAGILGAPAFVVGVNTACIEQAAQSTYAADLGLDGTNFKRGDTYDDWRGLLGARDRQKTTSNPTLMLRWMEEQEMA